MINKKAFSLVQCIYCSAFPVILIYNYLSPSQQRNTAVAPVHLELVRVHEERGKD